MDILFDERLMILFYLPLVIVKCFFNIENLESYILLKNVRFFAHHGVMEQETKVGNVFIVNLKLKLDLLQACRTDELHHTVSYADVYSVVHNEMNKPSKLLEHVAYRIMQKLRQNFKQIETIEIKLSKLNPPIGLGSQVEYATIHLIDNGQ